MESDLGIVVVVVVLVRRRVVVEVVVEVHVPVEVQGHVVVRDDVEDHRVGDHVHVEHVRVDRTRKCTASNNESRPSQSTGGPPLASPLW